MGCAARTGAAVGVIRSIDPEDGDEAEKVRDLRMALAYALDPYKREGNLL